VISTVKKTGRLKEHTIAIVIPVYNEAEVIQSVIDEVYGVGSYLIIVVDDGSVDKSFEAAQAKGVVTVRHKINRGKGAAVKTGIEVAKRLNADVVVTLDGDGQHDPKDVARLIDPIVQGSSDVVLGSRLLNREGMPALKILANITGNFFTLIFYGILVTDSQSGFRAFSKYAVSVIDTRADKYEYDSKVIREIKNNRLRFTEVPVQVRYTKYSMGKKHKQGFFIGVQTLARMIWDKLV